MLEADAFEQTRKLKSQGRRREYAEFPPYWVFGPLENNAELEGISYNHRLNTGTKSLAAVCGDPEEVAQTHVLSDSPIID